MTESKHSKKRFSQTQRQQFYSYYNETYSRNITMALLLALLALFATGLLDWLFQREVAAIIWPSRWATTLPILAMLFLSVSPRLRHYQQLFVILTTCLGYIAVLDFARLSVEPYVHYYTSAISIVTMIGFLLSRMLFRWGLVCSLMLILICNIYWLRLHPRPIDLLVVNNFILLLSLGLSLMASRTLEQTIFASFLQQQTSIEEQQRLAAMQEQLSQQSSRNEKIADFQSRISGNRSAEDLAQITLTFASELWEIGYAEVFLVNGNALSSIARSALPIERNSAHKQNTLTLGDGIVGQAALQKEPLFLTQIPQDYARITSGLGDMLPRQIVVIPVCYEETCSAVIELALIKPLAQHDQDLLTNLTDRLGPALAISMREGY